MSTGNSRIAKWESDAEFAEFREFLKSLGQSVNQIRKQRKAKADKAGKRVSKLPGPFTLEWMDTEPYRIDDKYLQGLISGNKNFTILTLFTICHKLKVQPQELFKSVRLNLDGN